MTKLTAASTALLAKLYRLAEFETTDGTDQREAYLLDDLTPSENGNLSDLKKKDLIETVEDDVNPNGLWVRFSAEGWALARAARDAESATAPLKVSKVTGADFPDYSEPADAPTMDTDNPALNRARARRALTALDAIYGNGSQFDDVTDFLADLMHFWVSDERLRDCIARAEMHHEAEA